MPTTTRTISDPLMQQVSERIEDRTGLHFPPARFADLERGLVQAAREAGSRDARTYAELLLSRDLHAADLDMLAGTLTIGETHFFRDPRTFEFLEMTLLPGLIAAKRGGDRRLRIWSAGCATGEEPYSLAILLHRLLPDLKDWHITILGTDLNPKVLARAAAGLYTEWAFRDAPDWVKPRYLTAHAGNRYELQPWLKRMVSFACLNLADDGYPSLLNNTNALDLIICRNVLLYFAPARIPQVVRRFHRALVDGGQLVLGAVEASQMPFPEFANVPAPGVALYRKEGGTRNAECGAKKVGVAPTISDSKSEIQNLNPALPTPRSDFRVPRSPVPPSETPQSLYAVGHYTEARAMILGDNDRSSAFRLPPSELALLAHCHANLGELTEALIWCERALATTRTDPALHFLRASILQELHRDAEALLALRNVLYLDPAHVFANFTMANLHRRRGQMPASAKHLTQVRQLLAHRNGSEELPESGGITVGQLNAILAATTGLEGGMRNAEGGVENAEIGRQNETEKAGTLNSTFRAPRSVFRPPRV